MLKLNIKNFIWKLIWKEEVIMILIVNDDNFINMLFKISVVIWIMWNNFFVVSI